MGDGFKLKSIAVLNPPINEWAIFGCPCGTGQKAEIRCCGGNAEDLRIQQAVSLAANAASKLPKIGMANYRNNSAKNCFIVSHDRRLARSL
jgi:hypothetical protein